MSSEEFGEKRRGCAGGICLQSEFVTHSIIAWRMGLMKQLRSCPTKESGGARCPSSTKRVTRTKQEGNVPGDNNGAIHGWHESALSHQPPQAHPPSTHHLEMRSGSAPPAPGPLGASGGSQGDPALSSSSLRRWARARQCLFSLPGDTNPPGRWAAEDEPLARLSQPSKSIFKILGGFFFKKPEEGGRCLGDRMGPGCC